MSISHLFTFQRGRIQKTYPSWSWRKSKPKERNKERFVWIVHTCTEQYRLSITFLFSSISISPSLNRANWIARDLDASAERETLQGEGGPRSTDGVWTSSERIPLVHTETENSHWLKVDKSIITLTTSFSLHTSLWYLITKCSQKVDLHWVVFF